MARKMIVRTGDESQHILEETEATNEEELRSLVKDNPDLLPIEEFGLIFDESTSNLDSISEQLVQELSVDRTAINIAAHRLSKIRHADKVIVLENGRIVVIGKHEELLN